MTTNAQRIAWLREHERASNEDSPALMFALYLHPITSDAVIRAAQHALTASLRHHEQVIRASERQRLATHLRTMHRCYLDNDGNCLSLQHDLVTDLLATIEVRP